MNPILVQQSAAHKIAARVTLVWRKRSFTTVKPCASVVFDVWAETEFNRRLASVRLILVLGVG